MSDWMSSRSEVNRTPGTTDSPPTSSLECSTMSGPGHGPPWQSASWTSGTSSFDASHACATLSSSGRLRISPITPPSSCWTISTTLRAKLGSSNWRDAIRSCPVRRGVMWSGNSGVSGRARASLPFSPRSLTGGSQEPPVNDRGLNGNARNDSSLLASRVLTVALAPGGFVRAAAGRLGRAADLRAAGAPLRLATVPFGCWHGKVLHSRSPATITRAPRRRNGENAGGAARSACTSRSSGRRIPRRGQPLAHFNADPTGVRPGQSPRRLPRVRRAAGRKRGHNHATRRAAPRRAARRVRLRFCSLTILPISGRWRRAEFGPILRPSGTPRGVGTSGGRKGVRSMYDVIVVGARCAGSPTAMLLARRGYRVLLVDKARFPSDTMSGHYVHQPGVAALARWRLLDRVAATNAPPVARWTFDAGCGLRLVGSPPAVDGVRAGYCVRRRVFDK